MPSKFTRFRRNSYWKCMAFKDINSITSASLKELKKIANLKTLVLGNLKFDDVSALRELQMNGVKIYGIYKAN